MSLVSHFKKLFPFIASFFSSVEGRIFLFLVFSGVMSYFFLDTALLEAASLFFHPYRPFFKALSFLIFPPFYLILPALLLLIFRYTGYRRSLTPPLFSLTLAQCLSIAVVRVFKVILGKARPDIFLSQQVQGFEAMNFDHHFHSFPSGHTMAAFTLATSLSLLFPRLRLVFLLSALILSLSRVFLYYHYLSDLFGTAAMGVFLAWISHRAVLTVTHVESFKNT